MLQKNFPKKRQRSRKYSLWMTNKARRSQYKYKSMMWPRYCLSKSYNDYVEYKQALNKATYKMARVNIEKRLAKDIKQYPKSLYSYVRSKS